MTPKDNPRRSIFQKIDVSKIGQGTNFTEGRFSDGRKKLGLKGQLGHLKHAGRFGTTKNLSQNDLKTFYNLISEKLKSHFTTSRVSLTRIEKRDIMEHAEDLRREGKISDADKADLENILKAIQEQGRAAVLKKNSTISPTSQIKPASKTNSSLTTQFSTLNLKPQINLDTNKKAEVSPTNNPTNSNKPKNSESKTTPLNTEATTPTNEPKLDDMVI